MKKLESLRKFIRFVISEDFFNQPTGIGRNYHTIDNDPYSWEDYPGIHADIYPMSNGLQWFAQVTVDFNDDLSTPARVFGSEEDARSYARLHAEKANRERLAKNIMTGTPTTPVI